VTLHNLEHDVRLSPFIKSVMTFENLEESKHTTLPFFADGFPGLMYHQTPNGLTVNPHQKRMPELFLYGQTIKPIELEITGAYRLLVFQLYPFTLKSLFGIDPKSINDNCYDLTHDANSTLAAMLEPLSTSTALTKWVEVLSQFISELIARRTSKFDPTILNAVEIILREKGQVNLTDTAKALHVTKRTFERRFLSETGLLPKQFAKIIQFHSSLTQLTVKDYRTLTDVVFRNGYADQSHFIRVFKSFTGKTPKHFTH
jgi:AraC-like DNA-binding protein